MTDYISKTIEAYNQSPDKYVESTKDMTPPVEFGRFVDMVRSLGGEKVLDAGCAFGRDTTALQEAGMQPVGIDLSDELLSRATETHPDLSFRKMDVRKLDFTDGSFDGIWCHTVLLHLKDEDISKALKEFHRVLKDNGIVFLSFKKGEGNREVLEPFSSDASRFYNFKTIEVLNNLLRDSGFKTIDSYYINEQQLFGPDKRDLDWVHCFAQKI